MRTSPNPEEAPRSNSRRFGREAVMQYLFSCELKGEMPNAAMEKLRARLAADLKFELR